MSIKTVEENARWGGKRPRSGRKKGSGKMMKISVSVDKQNWHNALAHWDDKGSQLVDRLVLRYIESGGGILRKGAAI